MHREYFKYAMCYKLCCSAIIHKLVFNYTLNYCCVSLKVELVY